jgi:hypothetical protein
MGHTSPKWPGGNEPTVHFLGECGQDSAQAVSALVSQRTDTVEKLFGEAKNSQSALTVFFYLFDFIEVEKRVF